MLCGIYTKENLGEKTKLMGKWRSTLPLKPSVFLWRCSMVCVPHWVESSKEKNIVVSSCVMWLTIRNNLKTFYGLVHSTKHLYKEYMHHFYQDLLGKCLGQAMLISSNGQDFWAFWTIYGWSACQRL